MTKLLAALLSLALPLLASAACTYSSGTEWSTRIATCTTTTEAAPTLVTEGLSLGGKKGMTVVVESSGTMTAGGTFQAYLWTPSAASGAGAWVRAPDLDLTAQALAKQAWPGFVVSVAQGRIDYRPSGTGALTTTIHLVSQ